MPYCMYLRKSRADKEAELRGEGDTLSRHEKILSDLAVKKNITIAHIYRESLSGESIDTRAEVKKLLSAIEIGSYDGVLVMEIERLARGDTKDQGIVARAFQLGNAAIITPNKIYYPNDEFDEEYLEFGLFMSRREYQTINRRMQRGRLASVKEGKYVASVAPYGYQKVRIPSEQGYTLSPLSKQADVVRTIFQLFTAGELLADGSYRRLGMHGIAKRLNSLQIPPPKSATWSYSTIKDILKNPVYIGKIRWQWRKEIKSLSKGSIVKKQIKSENYLLVKGLHEAIVSEDVFSNVQKILENRDKNICSEKIRLKNPLAGIVVCENCNSKMIRTNSHTTAGYFTLRCPNQTCSTVSSSLLSIEAEIIVGLIFWLNTSSISLSIPDVEASLSKGLTISELQRQRIELQNQMELSYESLEQGSVSVEQFFLKQNQLQKQRDSLENQITELQSECDFKSPKKNKNVFLTLDAIDRVYNELKDITEKNYLLKELLVKVLYYKIAPAKKGKREEARFELILYPRLKGTSSY